MHLELHVYCIDLQERRAIIPVHSVDFTALTLRNLLELFPPATVPASLRVDEVAEGISPRNACLSLSYTSIGWVVHQAQPRCKWFINRCTSSCALQCCLTCCYFHSTKETAATTSVFSHNTFYKWIPIEHIDFESHIACWYTNIEHVIETNNCSNACSKTPFVVNNIHSAFIH